MNGPFEQLLAESIVIDNDEIAVVSADIVAPPEEPAVVIPGDNARLIVTAAGSIAAPDLGNTAVESTGEGVSISNRGAIFGEFNGISSTGDGLELIDSGSIASNSRAVDLADGDDLFVINRGEILGTGDQRNGTLYINGNVDDARVVNGFQGTIDAGEGNLGDGISVQVGIASEDALNENIDLVNLGTIAGRGQPAFADGARLAANGSSGVRFFNGSDEEEAIVTGSVANSGTISSEAAVGFLGGLVIEDGVAFEGEIVNRGSGVIAGVQNGLYVGNSEHDLSIRNAGTITSDSRAVNLDGDNVEFVNSGDILGTGDQRNGTLYIDGTGDDISVTNRRSGVIDAGEGNLGDGIAVQVGAAGDAQNDNINISNAGTIAGRGQPAFADGDRLAANGSSGVRFFNGSGAEEATIAGSVTNSGTISSEAAVGFLGGLVIEDGVAFEGEIVNRRSGVIAGVQNGLYVGNSEHDLSIRNAGTITSDSRAVNLDGDNVEFVNSGDILGTGDQRNGTLYIDGTGDDISVTNRRSGVIDAGDGNSGSGVSVQVGAVGDAQNDNIEIVNNGSIQGRGTDNVPAGLRLFVGSGLETATFNGSITNQTDGVIASEEAAGILIEAGVIFAGAIVNDGSIDGGNGLALDASGALGAIEFVNNGELDGDVLLGQGNDIFVQNAAITVQANGGDGDDLLVSGGGINTFAGGAGSDTFRIEEGSLAVIEDFTIGEDVLDISAFFSDASALGAAVQDDSATVFTLDEASSVTLLGVDLSDLAVDSFEFA